MAKPNALIVTGYGINCDDETAFAFNLAGANAQIRHINDIIDGSVKLNDYQILVFPGGFSYGDDTGSGKALANRIRNNLWSQSQQNPSPISGKCIGICRDDFQKYIESDHLIMGICNGFQVMVSLGILPALKKEYRQQVALVHNNSARFKDRWIDLHLEGSSPWVEGIKYISLPIAHGEGRFYAEKNILNELNEKNLVAARYVNGVMCNYLGIETNPNGSLEDIAAITDETGRRIGLMPHPERAIRFTQLPEWPLVKEYFKRHKLSIPEYGPGLKIFQNAVKYFK